MKEKPKDLPDLWNHLQCDLESAISTWEALTLDSAVGAGESGALAGQEPKSLKDRNSLAKSANQEQIKKIKKLLNSITRQLDTFSE